MNRKPNNKPCKFFFEKGSCLKGLKCDFAHSIQKDSGIYGQKTSKNWQNSIPKIKEKNCKYFLEGECKSAAKCK